MSTQLINSGGQARTIGLTVPADRTWHLRKAWYRIRLTIQDMNHATRRMAELQRPRITDERQH